ncbi:chromobox protein homolog 1-like isoform X2 [Drosophila montana]|uniref:chromobox protein homolog 1-like isoform X2 n=1 Tax=Drosophila montana TaxID=40370 RepID=UPI00313D89F9
MGKKKNLHAQIYGKAYKPAPVKKMPANAEADAPQRPGAAASTAAVSATAAPIAEGTQPQPARPTPRQRGRPRKNPLAPDAAMKREDSVNNTNAIVKVLLRSLKDHNKPMATVNNGFARGLKPDTIVAGFRHEGQLMFAVKFKNRKLPELISSMELKLRAPSLLIQYYVTNLQYPHNE